MDTQQIVALRAQGRQIGQGRSTSPGRALDQLRQVASIARTPTPMLAVAQATRPALLPGSDSNIKDSLSGAQAHYSQINDQITKVKAEQQKQQTIKWDTHTKIYYQETLKALYNAQDKARSQLERAQENYNSYQAYAEGRTPSPEFLRNYTVSKAANEKRAAEAQREYDQTLKAYQTQQARIQARNQEIRQQNLQAHTQWAKDNLAWAQQPEAKQAVTGTGTYAGFKGRSIDDANRAFMLQQQMQLRSLQKEAIKKTSFTHGG